MARKPDQLDRQLKALAKLYRLPGGRKIIRDNREGIMLCLCEGVGKP